MKAFLAGAAGLITLIASCNEPVIPRSEHIKLTERRGGVYDVPIGIGSYCCFNFMLDTGASDVTISPTVFHAMVEEGYIRRGDLRGSQFYVTANGSTMRAYNFRMPPMQIGSYVVHDVIASVSPDTTLNRMLLGQSFLSKLPQWSIDYSTHTLRFSYDTTALRASTPTNDNEPIELCTPIQIVTSQTCVYLPGLLINKVN